MHTHMHTHNIINICVCVCVSVCVCVCNLILFTREGTLEHIVTLVPCDRYIIATITSPRYVVFIGHMQLTYNYMKPGKNPTQSRVGLVRLANLGN